MSNLRNRLPPLSSLAAFEAVSRLLSFSRAADELCQTQAAISRQIIGLEAFLEVAMFNRKPRGVELTLEGEQFASTVNPAINLISDAAMTIKIRRTDEFSIFSEPCIANYWVMPRISKFQLQFPNTKIKIITSDDLIDDSKETFDIGIQYGEANKKMYAEQASWPDEVVIVASPDLHEKMPSNVTLDDLLEYPFIHVERDGPGWISWSEYFVELGSELPDKHTSVFCNNYLSGIDAAIQGAGLLLGWPVILQSALDVDRLRKIGDFSITSTAGQTMYTKRNSVNAKPAQKFIDWIKSGF
jgi:LysR family glycine cleavage system transcriptional activator